MPVHDGPNYFEEHQYDGATSFFGGTPPLSQAVGYLVVVGFGALFSAITVGMVWLDYMFGGAHKTSEQFNTAGRSIKTGLIAVDIVSHWTWAATLLQSSNVAYQNGVSGPFWYASGATVQILLFGILAIEIKRKAPTAHTVLEIINARWGKTAHLVFFVFCILTNVIVTAMLLLGGAAVINALTGMNIYAAAFLIPLGVIAYTVFGGLKATFISSYLHTVIIYVALCIFTFTVYATSPELGSPGVVWEKLNYVSKQRPVEGNLGGSYLTMFSTGGLIFGIINIIGNFGTVFVDQACILAVCNGSSAVSRTQGLSLGGIMWFCIPFTLATTMGLGALALDLPISKDEANAGLVPPAVAQFLLGKGGAVLIVVMLYMAVTSSGSAELIAVSSLFTYDYYRTYYNPKATGAQIMRVSQYFVFGFGCFMGVLAIILLKINISLGYVYLLMGVIIGSAVVPVAYCLCWSKCTARAAIAGAIFGLIAGVASWLSTAYGLYGELTLATTGMDYPMLTGNLFAIFGSAFVCTTWSLLQPDAYDWQTTREIPLVDDNETGFTAEGPDSAEAMEEARIYIWKWGGGLTVMLLIVWPILALPPGVFEKGYFYFWVILSITWGLIATVLATLLPLWESKDALASLAANVMAWNVISKEEMQEDLHEIEKPRIPQVPGGNPYIADEEAEEAYHAAHDHHDFANSRTHLRDQELAKTA